MKDRTYDERELRRAIDNLYNAINQLKILEKRLTRIGDKAQAAQVAGLRRSLQALPI